MTQLRSHFWPLLALLGLSAGVAATVTAQDPKPAKPAKETKLAVVDLGLLFKQYQRKDAFEKRINAQRMKMKAELRADHLRLQRMRQAFQDGPFRKGSEPWLRERNKLKLAQHELELKQELMQASLKNEVERNTLQILKELEQTIRDYGARFGYTFIFKVDRAGAGPIGIRGDVVEGFQERIFRAQISDVLYHDKAATDITPQVARLLNSPANLRKMERSERRR